MGEGWSKGLVMMSITLVDVPVLQLFAGRLAQPHDFYVEMELVPGERVVEIQRDVFAVDRVDAGVTRLPGIIPHG